MNTAAIATPAPGCATHDVSRKPGPVQHKPASAAIKVKADVHSARRAHAPVIVSTGSKRVRRTTTQHQQEPSVGCATATVGGAEDQHTGVFDLGRDRLG